MTQEEELIELRQRNSLLEEQVKQIPALQESIKQLREQVNKLQAQLAKNSQNSSLPPSSDRFSRQKKSQSLRTKSGKKPGGQTGHPGHTLQMSTQPTEVIELAKVTRCEHCQADLSETIAQTIERRQVIDVAPPPPLQVTQYEGEWKQCPSCQGYSSATFPTGVSAPVQYGPRIAALAVYLTTQQLLPRRRTKEVLADLLGVSLSEGTLTTVIKRAARLLLPIEEQIKKALSQARVIHQDETGLYVKGLRFWMHVTCTRTLTHYQVHRSRGHQALDEIGILTNFHGTSVHDAWAAYFRYACQQSLCCVHILRELTFFSQDLGLWWSAKMKRLLLQMKRATDTARAQGRTSLSITDEQQFRAAYLRLLDEGDHVHPRAPNPVGKRGRPKQHPARNLLDRLRKHQDAVLAFLSDLDVPFDNNLAEQDVRMVKVQQKVSGTFRSDDGAIAFARIRGYVSTLRKQGLHIFSALEATLRGHPLLPSF